MKDKKKKKKSFPQISQLLNLADHALPLKKQQEIQRHIVEAKRGICEGVDTRNNLAIIYAGSITVSKGYKFQFANDYPFYRLVYTLHGTGTIIDNKKEYYCEAGSVYGFAPGESGCVFNSSNTLWTHFYIHFTGVKAEQMFNEIMLSSRRRLQLSNPNEIQQLFENIVSECINRADNYQIICESFLKILLLKLQTQSLDNYEHISESRVKYLECKNYIEQNYNELVSIAEVAEKCYINKGYLCRLFRRYSGISPMSYITKLKMSKASILLIQTDYSIKQISMILHFSDQYYFSKTFKKAYGVSPTEYRRGH
jgi:AraC family transcriptional regulator, arabinose operon regulatory protein